jgi:hypothetical protein
MHGAFVEGIHEHAVVLDDRDPALAFQRDQRLTDRDARYAQCVGDRVLRQPLALSEHTVEDEAQHVLAHLFAAAHPSVPRPRRRQLQILARLQRGFGRAIQQLGYRLLTRDRPHPTSYRSRQCH